MNSTRIIKKYRLKKKVRKSLNRLLITIIVVLLALISIKKDPSIKELMKEKVYTKDIVSLKIKKIYQQYFSNKKDENQVVQPVSKEKIPYQKILDEQDGVKLIFSSIYPTPVLESGVLVYIDEEKGIIEQIDGVKATYTNIDIKNYKLYDYLEKGDILGETKSKELILSFQKEGETVDYQNYL